MTNRIAIALILILACHNGYAAGYSLQPVIEDLDSPWCVAFLPDGEYLITEIAGNVKRVSSSGIATSIGGVPDVYLAGQGGLFDALPHPDFASNGLVYLSYAAGELRDNTTTVARARLVGNDFQDLEVVFATSPPKNTPMHYGGRIAWLPDGTLLLTTGDGFDFREKAQDKSSHLGKSIRMTDTGEPAPDNPFAEAPYVWTYGHRNPQGLAVGADGTVYLNEHGPQGGDEVNVLESANNYGWPAITYGKDYNGALVSPFTEWPGLEQPIHTWVPSIAPSGFAIYEGSVFPEWSGSLFIGALVDREVRRLTLDGGKVIAEESLFSELGKRIRDVRAGPAGFLYVLTDGPNGGLYRVIPER